jgi:hypothetical protein
MSTKEKDTQEEVAGDAVVTGDVVDDSRDQDEEADTEETDSWDEGEEDSDSSFE